MNQTKTNEQSKDTGDRKLWIDWMLSSKQIIGPVNREYLLDIIDEGISGWKQSHDTFIAGCRARNQEVQITGDTSDGYHTFNDLYEHRRVLTVSLFNMDADKCFKSKLHDDGTMFNDYFIVGILTVEGWSTYHYHIKHWDDFKCNEVEKFPAWDGHTSNDAIKRIEKHFKNLQQQITDMQKKLKGALEIHEIEMNCATVLYQGLKTQITDMQLKQREGLEALRVVAELVDNNGYSSDHMDEFKIIKSALGAKE